MLLVKLASSALRCSVTRRKDKTFPNMEECNIKGEQALDGDVQEVQ